MSRQPRPQPKKPKQTIKAQSQSRRGNRNTAGSHSTECGRPAPDFACAVGDCIMRRRRRPAGHHPLVAVVGPGAAGQGIFNRSIDCRPATHSGPSPPPLAQARARGRGGKEIVRKDHQAGIVMAVSLRVPARWEYSTGVDTRRQAGRTNAKLTPNHGYTHSPRASFRSSAACETLGWGSAWYVLGGRGLLNLCELCMPCCFLLVGYPCTPPDSHAPAHT